MYEFNITRKNITDAIKESEAELRAEALNKIHTDINGYLERLLEDAKEKGRKCHRLSDFAFEMPEYFRNSEGKYEFPEEINEALRDAGYNVILEGKEYSLT